MRLPEGAGREGGDPEDGGRSEGGLLGRTIGELAVRTETGASVLAVVRGDKVIPNPGADLRLEPSDAWDPGHTGATGRFPRHSQGFR